jgi:hypothetical protein
MRTLVTVALGCFLAFCSNGSSPPDGGNDAAPDVTADVRALDVAPDTMTCPSGLACEICDNGFSPTIMPAPYNHANVCSAGDISAFIAACGTSGSSTACSTWQTNEGKSSPNCYDCVYSNQNAMQLGVWICDNTGTCALNSAGCVDVLTGEVSEEKQANGSGSCGDLIDADNACDAYACGNCVGGQQTACINSAGSTVCAMYHSAVATKTGPCAALVDASTVLGTCSGFTDTEYQAMTTAMCGM